MANANTNHGEMSWTDDFGSKKERISFKDLFLTLNDGNNIVRVFTNPHQFYQHKYKPEGDPGYGKRIQCSKSRGSCPVCDLGDTPKRRWYVGVIDRKTNTTKIVEVGFGVVQKLQGLAKDEDWGNPNQYDINIKVDRNGGATGYYDVIAKPKKALSLQDQTLIEQFDYEDLKRRAEPPAPEKVKERLEKILSGSTPQVNTSSISTKAAPKASQQPNDDDEEFGNADSEEAPF